MKDDEFTFATSCIFNAISCKKDTYPLTGIASIVISVKTTSIDISVSRPLKMANLRVLKKAQ